MTTTSVSSVDYEIAEYVDEAFERCGISPDSLTGRHARSARRSFDLFLKLWSAKHPNLWKITEQSFIPEQGGSEITLDVGSFAVTNAILRDVDGNDAPLNPLARSDWLAISDKTLEGRPEGYWVEHLQNERRVHFWPAQGTDAYTLIFYVGMYVWDVGVPTQTLDVPAEWMEAITAQLAFALSIKFAPDRSDKLERYARDSYKEARQSNYERSELRFVMGGGGYK